MVRLNIEYYQPFKRLKLKEEIFNTPEDILACQLGLWPPPGRRVFGSTLLWSKGHFGQHVFDSLYTRSLPCPTTRASAHRSPTDTSWAKYGSYRRAELYTTSLTKQLRAASTHPRTLTPSRDPFPPNQAICPTAHSPTVHTAGAAPKTSPRQGRHTSNIRGFMKPASRTQRPSHPNLYHGDNAMPRPHRASVDHGAAHHTEQRRRHQPPHTTHRLRQRRVTRNEPAGFPGPSALLTQPPRGRGTSVLHPLTRESTTPS